MKLSAVIPTLLVASSVALAAHADPSSSTPAAPNATTLPTIVIVGRYQRPVAAVEVSRAKMALPLSPLTPPFALRVEDATRRDPY